MIADSIPYNKEEDSGARKGAAQCVAPAGVSGERSGQGGAAPVGCSGSRWALKTEGKRQ
jgi:hypothetical protein